MQVNFHNRTLELNEEFENICRLCELCNTPSSFMIPDPAAPNGFLEPLSTHRGSHLGLRVSWSLKMIFKLSAEQRGICHGSSSASRR